MSLDDLTLDEVTQFGPEFGEDFYAAITLEATLDCHDVSAERRGGGCKQALAEARSVLQLRPERLAETS